MLIRVMLAVVKPRDLCVTFFEGSLKEVGLRPRGLVHRCVRNSSKVMMRYLTNYHVL